jgi:hypothetical protein
MTNVNERGRGQWAPELAENGHLGAIIVPEAIEPKDISQMRALAPDSADYLVLARLGHGGAVANGHLADLRKIIIKITLRQYPLRPYPPFTQRPPEIYGSLAALENRPFGRTHP